MLSNEELLGKHVMIESHVSKNNKKFGRVCAKCKNPDMVYVYFDDTKKKVLFMNYSLYVLDK